MHKINGFHIKLLCSLLLWFSIYTLGQSQTDNRPNVVFILSDDLGYGDLSCYNKDSKIQTPNLDQLATQGIRFTDSHAPSSLCSPTRYSVLTGRYAWRSRLTHGVLAIFDKPLIAPNQYTLAQLFKDNGYATAAIGKWHLGFDWQTTDGQKPKIGSDRLSNVDFTKSIGGPVTRGFDYYFGVDLPNFPPYCFIENQHTVGIPSLPDTGKVGGFNRPGPMLPGWQLVNILPTITDHAVSYIEEAAKTKKPFFLYFALTSPHFPIVPTPDFVGKSKAGAYGDFVEETDAMVGKVLEALKRTGLADNTLVIFTSDNGPEVAAEVGIGAYERAHVYGHYSMGPLRGVKRDTWEGGHRVPFIACWPHVIPENTTSTELISHVDMMATTAAILGTHLPDSAGVDSVNALPALKGEKVKAPLREALVHHSGSGDLAIRQGDWVFIDAKSGNANGARGQNAWFNHERGYVSDNYPGQLYNLTEDISERKNYYAEHPEIVTRLKTLLEKYKKEGRSTPGLPQKNDTTNKASDAFASIPNETTP